MCFKTKKPKGSSPAVQVAPISQPPIEQSVPQTQSGADIAASQKKKKGTPGKSLFEIELTIPVGSAGGTGTGSATPATTDITGSSVR